ncbi:hypothetical protein GCM10018791_71700 [Streptomyces zaomyceticus]|nr:hypothetical protein GCM10018791_71700 [Streptomyces zaomyceticus]
MSEKQAHVVANLQGPDGGRIGAAGALLARAGHTACGRGRAAVGDQWLSMLRVRHRARVRAVDSGNDAGPGGVVVTFRSTVVWSVLRVLSGGVTPLPSRVRVRRGR